MAITAYLFDSFMEHAFKGDVDLSSDTIKVQLHTSSYSPNRASDEHQSDLSNEASGTGYTAGGQALANSSLSISSHVLAFKADDTDWTNATITARYAVLVDTAGGSAASNVLVGYVDFGSDKSASNGHLKIEWDTSGIITADMS